MEIIKEQNQRIDALQQQIISQQRHQQQSDQRLDEIQKTVSGSLSLLTGRFLISKQKSFINFIA